MHTYGIHEDRSDAPFSSTSYNKSLPSVVKNTLPFSNSPLQVITVLSLKYMGVMKYYCITYCLNFGINNCIWVLQRECTVETFNLCLSYLVASGKVISKVNSHCKLRRFEQHVRRTCENMVTWVGT